MDTGQLYKGVSDLVRKRVAEIFEELVLELYHRAQCAKHIEERKAIKGVQHSLERVLEKHGVSVSRCRTNSLPVGGSDRDREARLGDGSPMLPRKPKNL